jgi:hypothetical protein
MDYRLSPRVRVVAMVRSSYWTCQGFAESGGIWSQVGDAIAGVDADRFGRSVSIADNGSRLAASSYIHDGSRGHLRLFDLTGELGPVDQTLMVKTRLTDLETEVLP